MNRNLKGTVLILGCWSRVVDEMEYIYFYFLMLSDDSRVLMKIVSEFDSEGYFLLFTSVSLQPFLRKSRIN